MCIGDSGLGVPPQAGGSGSCSSRSFPATKIKFSVFMRTSGSAFDWTTSKCPSGSIPSHVGIRQQYFIGSYNGNGSPLTVNSSDVSFNNGVSAASIGSTSITSAKIGDISLTFPTMYTYGTVLGNGSFSTTDRGSVIIKYAGLGDESFALDYFFDRTHLNAADTWVAYDPDVECTNNCGASSSAAAVQAPVFAALLALLAAAWSL
jgi:hypothetical protein